MQVSLKQKDYSCSWRPILTYEKIYDGILVVFAQLLRCECP
jgi:hypothetical protein